MKTFAALSALLIVLAGIPLVVYALPPVPTFGAAVVDGFYSEWNLAKDFFADMYRAGNETKPLESKLYLRYNCLTNTLYALVLCEPGIAGYIDSTATTAWIAIDTINHKVVNESSGNDGVPPDFAWIGRGYDGNQWHAQGYEASFIIGPGTYSIIAHIDVLDGEPVAVQTSATPGFPKEGPDLEIPLLPSATQRTTFGAIKAMYR